MDGIIDYVVKVVFDGDHPELTPNDEELHTVISEALIAAFGEKAGYLRTRVYLNAEFLERRVKARVDAYRKTHPAN